MRVLWFTWTLITAEPWHRTLPDAKLVFYYDKITRPPGLLRIPPDQEMLDIAASYKPDVILFCGIADGSRMPSAATFRTLRRLCPVVLLSGDLSDPPWWPYLDTFRREQCFDIVVNFDGNDSWPKCTARDLTSLTPLAPEFYMAPKPLKDRIIPFGFAGGYASSSRADIINYLIQNAGLQVKTREEVYGTYGRFARFMMECRVTVNVPYSGSDNSRQVKGRVLESGLAKVCLLDHVSSESRKWFTPGVDYIEYETAEHAAALSKELLADLDRAQEIAESLHRRVTQEHSPDKFWAKVFAAIGK